MNYKSGCAFLSIYLNLNKSLNFFETASTTTKREWYDMLWGSNDKIAKAIT